VPCLLQDLHPPQSVIITVAPPQKPGRSKQDYQTPPEFLEAVLRYLHIADFTIDLAASAQNAVTARYYSQEENALALHHRWNVGPGWAWCNPPFGHIEPWVQRAAYEQRECGAQIAMLLPAGVGSNWFKRWGHEKARVIFLNGRLTFVGETTCYPKDCLLLLYSPYVTIGYEVWNWRR
jgi:phage N-6-adenine-methyltransferase